MGTGAQQPGRFLTIAVLSGSTEPRASVSGHHAVQRLLLVLLMGLVLGRAEIVDRIAATVGSEVIAESQVEEQIRISAFINGTEPDFSVENKRKVLDNLIEQVLIRREIEFTRFPAPKPEEVQPLLKQVKDRFPGDDAWHDAMKKRRHQRT